MTHVPHFKADIIWICHLATYLQVASKAKRKIMLCKLLAHTQEAYKFRILWKLNCLLLNTNKWPIWALLGKDYKIKAKQINSNWWTICSFEKVKTGKTKHSCGWYGPLPFPWHAI
jgi:hypothetical protein